MKLIVDVQDALQRLTKNKQKHIAEYDLQLEAWKAAYLDYSDSLKFWSSSQGEQGAETQAPKEPIKPHYHIEEYNKLIAKLNIHLGKGIELDDTYSKEYDQIFENKFEWSNRFTTLSSSYITAGYINAADKLKIDSLE
jgi:hypothetical protein